MRRILITGANSYIGTSFDCYLKQWPEEYEVDTLDVVGDIWRKKSFHGYDVVFHVAGIVHQKEKKENEALYYRINQDLSIKIARKAKQEGVTQFVFLSSMSVYGMDTGIITKKTVPKPNTYYGKSKLAAEKGLLELKDDCFAVTIVRPPMVYGKGCKGNFQTLIKIAQHTTLFPAVSNERSMIYIDNLSCFIKLIIDQKVDGLFFPQNRSYSTTGQLMVWIGEVLGKEIRLYGWMNVPVRLMMCWSKKAQKAFGTLIYQDMEVNDFCYCKTEEKQSILKSV